MTSPSKAPTPTAPSHQGHGHGHGGHHHRWAFSAGHRAPRAKADDHGHHGHSHGLGDHSTATGRHRKKLIIVLCITASIFLMQVVGAMISNSLALLADAGHMLTDATGVFIALIASVIATRPASAKRTFGYQRVEVLAALLNGVAIAAIAVLIFVEAVQRLGTDVEVESGPMLFAAIAGAVANLVSLLILQSGQKESLNVRGAYLEVLGDLLGSVAVIIAGIIIWLTGWMLADQIASIAIALLILPRAWSLLKDVLNVLMEATPKDMDLEETRAHLLSVPGVQDVHDMHAWTITSGVPVFSAHVVVDDGTIADGSHAILDELLACLGEHFDTGHSTLQIESRDHASHEQEVHA
ncbi:cation diffusion facilitator family transporter [Sinomonas mesophila]|uniref:cation diffusion facilitator family transporter n=1 Tax=Sinomonas mesophila TaxID=1531955 RepID=UPI000987C2CF|nr:cation diffusion facilitator family transporter [Sinomonas mesophila]